MIPIYIYNGQPLPANETYYVVASNGTFIHKHGVFQSLVRVENIPFIEPISPYISPKFPPIPQNLANKVRLFFKTVLEVYRAEANVLVYFNPENKQFKIHVPYQQVARNFVNYERKLSPEETLKLSGFLCIGTIHSHCDFEAFHSGVDVDDEKHFDGLHVTFGNNQKEAITIAASLVSNNYRQLIFPCDVIEGIVPVDGGFKFLTDCNENIDDWLKKVKNA
jgi:hypothetical protein